MKMFMIVCPETRRADIRELIAEHEVHAYTELRQVTGEGDTGKKLGTETWPETSIIILAVVPDDKQAELMNALKTCRKTLFPGEGMRAFVMPVEAAL